MDGKKMKILLGLVMGLLVAFVCVDCGAGHRRYLECEVEWHEYKPAWTEVWTSTDSDGNTQIHTTHHEEEFHLICLDLGQGKLLDCGTGQSLYDQITNSQPVTVCVREGRWTGHRWMPEIDSY